MAYGVHLREIFRVHLLRLATDERKCQNGDGENCDFHLIVIVLFD